jgi:cell division protein FtsB
MSGFTIMMFVLLVIGVVILAPSLKLLIEQKTQIAGLQKAVADQKHHTAELRSQVARWDDPAYIEAQARNRLLFVFPGETSYLVVNDLPAATAATGGPISTKIQTTKVDWVSSLTSSLLTAGLTTSPAPVSDTPIQSPVTGNG